MQEGCPSVPGRARRYTDRRAENRHFPKLERTKAEEADRKVNDTCVGVLP